MAPECLRGDPCSPAADVYSFGVIAYECLVHRPPHERDTVREQLAAIDAAGAGGPPHPPACSLEMALLLQECLNQAPELRPPAAEIDRRLTGWEPAALSGCSGLSRPCSDSSQHGNNPICRRWQRSSRLSAALLPTLPAVSQADSPLQSQKVPSSAGTPSSVAADRLMRDMFPEHVVEALMRGERVPPEPKEMVSS